MSAKVNTSRMLHTGRVFNIYQDNVTLENGACLDMEIIRHPGASAIVAMTPEKEILLIKQYRYAVGGFIWEIPAGTFNGKEPPLECAMREFTEETGYIAKNWEKLGETTPVPGYSDERIHLFLARDLTKRSQNLDHDEILDVYKIAYEKVLSMVNSGEIQDAKTLAALFLANASISSNNL
jgi:ADP-ribose pyrophosphatase